MPIQSIVVSVPVLDPQDMTLQEFMEGCLNWWMKPNKKVKLDPVVTIDVQGNFERMTFSYHTRDIQ